MPFKIVRNDITRCERYDAITCGVYGCMMHTAFCNKSHSQEVFDNMKKDLQESIDKDTTADVLHQSCMPAWWCILSSVHP